MIRLVDVIDGEFSTDIVIVVSDLKVKEVEGNGGQVNKQVENVTEIQFDKSTGFNVTDNGAGEVFVELNSSFADIYVDGQTTLEAEGEDEIQYIAGEGVEIETTTSHTGSASKAITFSSKGTTITIDASDGSDDIPLFQNMIEHPENYRGRIIYVSALGSVEYPDPFLWADKFYFNEGGEWHESPFSFKLG